jgi:chromosome segregation ATPase
MYLKSLEVTGFKSFGKKAVLEFTAPISAIVGPNGSGKSNIAEAFRFVLGEQSIKSLRGKRGEDLIFNGGKSMPRQNRASVKVLFDNRKRILNLDFDEVVIERAVNRDGTNEYKINGSDVRLKDIVEILSSAHIGSSGHHIISQGEADRMLNATLRERREILEEALGLKMHQYKKEEGQKKLEKTEINMKETEGLLREIAPHLRFLKKQYEKIEKAQIIRAELLEIGKIYFRTETDYVHKKTAELEIKRQDIIKGHNELLGKKEELSKNINTNIQTEENINLKTLEEDLKRIYSEKDIKTREIGKTEGEISYITRSIKKFEQDENQIQEIKVSLREIEYLRDEVFKIESLEEAKNLLNKFISKYKEEKQIHQELISLKKELEILEENKVRLQNDLVGIQEREADFVSEIRQERMKGEEKKRQSMDSERELMLLQSLIRESEEQQKRITMEEEMLNETKAILKIDLEELAFLLGRDILSFENLESSNESEERSVQHERKRSMERFKIRLEEAGISNATDVLKEYKETEERDTFLRRELDDLEISKASLLTMIKELDERINIEFKSGVQKINDEFNELFRLMFGGGEAKLEIVREKIKRKKNEDESDLDSIDELLPEEAEGEEGIDISVELPHKKTKGLMMLSGGERALTSIALLFAMSQVNPPPFIILDETDAALDEANSRKYGDMIEKLAKHSELILITHNRETMSRAGVIYGVTMASEGTSKLLSIKFDEAVAVAK